jgi:hypothetical protein
VPGQPQSGGAITDAAATTSYVQFTAQAGKDIVILYRAQTSSTAVSKNVMLNGFELDTPNLAAQPTQPSPADGDERVNADTGSVTLSWTAASRAVSHDVYFGEDPAEVQSATPVRYLRHRRLQLGLPRDGRGRAPGQFTDNYYKPGAATTMFFALNAQYDSFPGTQQYYFAGNVMPGVFDLTTEDSGREFTGTPNGYSPWVTAPFFPSYATTQSAAEAYKNVLSDVGADEPVLDDHGVRVAKETLHGTYTYKGSVSGLPGLIDSEVDVGGYESYPADPRPATWDSDGGGLPDWWETQFGLNLHSPPGDYSDANVDTDGDGYRQLDEYLGWMAGQHYFTSMGSSVAVTSAERSWDIRAVRRTRRAASPEAR